MKERLLDVMKWGLIIIIAGAALYFIVNSLKGEPLTTFSIMVTALATIFIAIYAGVSHRLTSRIQSRDEESKQRIEDLYQGIMVSVFIASMGDTPAFSTMEHKIKEFNNYYKGETSIFK